MSAEVQSNSERQAYYDRIAPAHLTPLWEVFADLVTPEPKSQAIPAVWHYDKIRPFILESGGLITAMEAVRRVLILENPNLPGQSKITNTLYAGLQLILPGEVAPAHRHSQSALRFIVEGQGAYTAVEGEKTIMSPGDFVTTPSWAWHDHGNDTDQPMVWLDGLDIPIVNFFDASFAENLDQDSQSLSKPAGDSLARYGAGMLPMGYEQVSPTSPVFNYPYARTREALEQMRKVEEWDPCHGLKMCYINPVTGDYAMPTMATFMQLIPNGLTTAPYRSTDGMVYSVVEGSGRTFANGQELSWGPRDTFIIPSWCHHHHEVDGDAVLFSFSDRPIQEKLGLWRQDRGNH
ncbi:MAG: gentisate 1,2-dioxygenase [Rhodospirillaceae bacterium]|jgi:gentisate 1,2-dioxygenase|nr:gentisate 1,2-dioxygenase [Rhodospirillaceae bacterium]MBT5082211.1 gentisate 1,2-dioxygenase [Rhodospirillaceae bacterium]MBT5526730.1 gentisate 1,2-dioxygenase [Rhodospirillaceae bacterium]MBT5879095.1 gentisate 1,2-dioxygenase [Rhodospirillaceae bacterium]MBT6588478.1 gentisate 1,2-dioxygenase [Rhodospirillaceae bacterium]